MQRLVHRHKRISHLFRSLRHPQNFEISLDGINLKLPLRTPFKDLPSIQYSSDNAPTLQRLAYAFSVFGCIAPESCCSTISIYVSTRSSRAHVPIEFCRFFGGGVYLSVGNSGSTQPRISWKVTGRRAIELSKFLSELDFPSRKREILKIGANWPSGIQDKRDVAENLRTLKNQYRKHFFKSGKIETWRDLVELFDKKGHVTILQGSKLRIAISHPNIQQLQLVNFFLNKAGLGKIGVTKGIHEQTNSSYWYCQKRASVKWILMRLLQHGLTFQRARAEAALSLLEQTSHRKIRELSLPERRFLLDLFIDETSSMKYRRSPIECCLAKEMLSSVHANLKRNKGSLSLEEVARNLRLVDGLENRLRISRLEAALNKIRGDLRAILTNIRINNGVIINHPNK